MGALVKLDGVNRTYGSVKALSSITQELAPGTFTTLVGPSGCGKSTLLDIIAGLNSGFGGTASIDGAPITGPRRETGVIFQEAAVLPWRTVLDNAAFALEIEGVPVRKRREVAADVLRRVGLSHFADHYPHQLSGGMRQRVAIARVLSTNPDLVLADEPFGALDEQTRVVLGLELLRVVRQTQATVLFVTHSIQEAVLLSDRVLVMGARPGAILLDLAVNLPGDREPSSVGSPDAAHLIEEIWSVLRSEAERALTEQGARR